MRRERMNNKGFSLVELIIVIAIMAILAAALAPQLMKYIEKSRVSTDSSTCASIESCINAALTEEEEFQQIYALDVIQIPPNKPIIRVDKDDLIYRTKAGKLKAIAEEIALKVSICCAQSPTNTA